MSFVSRLWPRPSLVRRVVLTVLATFVLVWSVLLARDYFALKHDLSQRASLQQLAQVLAASLDVDDAARAREVLRASAVQYNHLRRQATASYPPYPGDLLLLLESTDGTPVFASEAAQGKRIPAGMPGPESQTVGSQVYWSAIALSGVSPERPRWRVQVLEPRMADSRFLRLIGAELLPSLLIALPLVVLPVWLAVRRGLRPLRTLAEEVATRPRDDFSPLTQRAQHAELRPLIDAFNALFAKARAGIARERALVQDAAHELRTPLAVIAAQAHVLAHADTPQHACQAKIALEHAVTRASHLVQQLLTLATLEEGGPRPLQSVDLVETARALLIAASPAATAKGIDLALDSPERLPANLDVSAFHSVLENLLGNAIAYCPDGAEVSVSLASCAEGIQLQVADNGPGIAPDIAPLLFERFRRGREARSHGAGLGLAIVAQALLRMHGRIVTGPGLGGRGVAFSVSFPAGSV